MSETPETQSWEKLTSLEGTTWKGIEDLGDGAAIISEMTFTDTIATFKSEWQDGKRCSHFSGKYIYNPDKETFVMPNESEQTNWDPPADWEWGTIPDLEGTIENGIMTFDEWISFDVYWTVTLKKQ